MINPAYSLASSIQPNPSVYAVHIGSSVSWAGNISKGWEKTLDLIRKLAKLHKQACEPDLETGYLGKFEKEASYSNLLNELTRIQAKSCHQTSKYGKYFPNKRIPTVCLDLPI